MDIAGDRIGQRAHLGAPEQIGRPPIPARLAEGYRVNAAAIAPLDTRDLDLLEMERDDLFVRSSFADYLAEWLLDAMTEYKESS